MNEAPPSLPKRTLTRKLTAIFAAFGVLLLLLGWFVIYLTGKEMTEYALTFQAYRAEEEAERIDNYIEQTINDLKSFYILKDDIAKDDFALTITHVYQLFLVNKGIASVRIISPTGAELVGITRTGLIPKEELGIVKDEAYFQAAKQGRVFISEAAADDGVASAFIAIPYFENFRLLGVVAARVEFRELFNAMTLETTFASGHLHIVSKEGKMLGAPDSRLVGQDVAATDLFKQLTAAGGSLTGAECADCMERNVFAETLASARQIKNPLGFFVILESDKTQVFELYYQLRRIVGGAIALFLVLAAFVIRRANARVNKTLQAFIAGFENLHAGRLKEKVVLKTGDEVEYLAEHFNHIGAAIEKSTAEKDLALAKFKEIDAVKYNFIKTISHQLRTPITSMLWLLENLTDQLAGALTKEQNSLFQNVYKAIQNINGIANDIILTVDVDDGRMTLDVMPADILEVLDAAVTEVRPLAAEKGVAITVKKPAESLPRCAADHKKIRFVMTRLLENAIMYSEPKAGKEVTMGVDAHGGQILFFVADQGIGIPAAEQGLIFTKFYRATNAYKLIQNASGLSLYIAKYFIELHGGRIWFDSQEGVGTNFYFSVPIEQGKKARRSREF